MKKKNDVHTTHISFAMMKLQDGRLSFSFHGAGKQTVMAVFGNLKNLCADYMIKSEHNIVVNGKCHYSIVVTLKEPRTDILPEADWPMMITRFLQKETTCDVTYFDKYEKFMNE